MFLADINEEGLKTQVKQVNDSKKIHPSNSAEFILLDVTKQDNWVKGVKYIVEYWGRLDILVNNAGTSYRNKVCASYFVVFGILMSV